MFIRIRLLSKHFPPERAMYVLGAPPAERANGLHCGCISRLTSKWSIRDESIEYRAYMHSIHPLCKVWQIESVGW